MIDHFDHRAKTYASGHGNSSVWIERGFGDPEKAIVPQWRVLRGDLPGSSETELIGTESDLENVANPRNERSLVACIVPPGSVCGDKVPTLDFGEGHEWFYLPWLAVANSFVMDWLSRTKLTSPKMAFSLLDSLPFPHPAQSDAFVETVGPVVLRLTCTAPEMTPFWNEMAKLGFVPSVPDSATPTEALLSPVQRQMVRAELDALVASTVFGLNRTQLGDIMESFDVLRRRDEKTYGEFRTKRMVLEAFDRRC